MPSQLLAVKQKIKCENKIFRAKVIDASQTYLSVKYHGFLAPKMQILINEETLQEKHGVSALSVIVEEAAGMGPKFSFAVKTLSSLWQIRRCLS